MTDAFNSIPREEILRGLDQASVPLILRNYIEAFLQLRHAAHLDSVPCGVPQGDPLSMLLYCVGQNLFIKELKARYPRLIAYADDILIFHSDNSDATGIITEATTLAKRYGLTVNIDKCRSTKRTGGLLPGPALEGEAVHGPQGDREGSREPEAGDGRPITHHAKLTLTRINVVPMANYAPLVEMDSPVEQYESFDRQVGEALGGILGSDPKRWIEFLAAPKRNGGLGVHLPGVCHKQLRDAVDTLDVRTGHREPVAERDDLTMDTGSYINHVFGSFLMLPDDAFRRLSERCGLGPTVSADRVLSSKCVLCGARMDGCEPHRQLQPDASVQSNAPRRDLVLGDHIVSKKKCTVVHEQKVWVDHDKANQKPDLFLPDTSQAIDIGVVQPASMSSYYRSKIEAYGERTLPIIIGTNGTLHEKTKDHLRDLGIDILKFMAYAIFVIEHQHHKTTLEHMARVNCSLKARIAVATDGKDLR
ncbi:Reverse transcriptase [Giardia lamblia P15]|uniref:Reverse transcriptase n=1 Tax=Giardia intestinalis (strain P15) TaxID=658858 RepID=E1F9R7_GIAIA|nr:Reverse transcriptase [Giardia lamblia P15]